MLVILVAVLLIIIVVWSNEYPLCAILVFFSFSFSEILMALQGPLICVVSQKDHVLLWPSTRKDICLPILK